MELISHTGSRAPGAGPASAWLAGVVLSLLAVLPASAASTGSFVIAYKPSAQVLEYKVTQLDRISDLPEKTPADWKVSEIHQIISQQLAPGTDGNLAVMGHVMAEKTFDSQNPDQPEVPLEEPRPFRYDINVRGGFIREPALSDATAVLLPSFPSEAISPGHTWERERPVAPGLYFTVRIKHEFLEVQVIQGMPCAIIVSSGEVKDASADGRTGVAWKGNGRTAMSLADGQLMYTQLFTALALKTAPSGTTPNVLRRETLRSMKRVAPGSPDAAGQ